MKWFFKLRGVVMLPPLVFAYFCTWNEVEDPLLIYSIGGGVFALGMIIRIWAQMHLHYRLKIKKVLTTTGPYRYCRNPIYIGNTLILTSFPIFCELFWFIPVVFVYCIIYYTFVILYEESVLKKKYGEPYEEYCARVPRWIPRRPVGENAAVAEFFFPSILAEAHCLAIALVAMSKELFY